MRGGPRCEHHWVARRGGTDRCDRCGDVFPCPSLACLHYDCIARAIELGRRKFPRDYPRTLSVVADGHSHGACAGCEDHPEDHYEVDVDPALPPEEWVLPRGWLEAAA